MVMIAIYRLQLRLSFSNKSLQKQLIPIQSITDIALDCGFNSQSHLGKYFRAITGMTPKAYRQDKS
jgi:AraC family transcriptional regulator